MSEIVTLPLGLREVRGTKYVCTLDSPSDLTATDQPSTFDVSGKLLKQILADAEAKVDLRHAAGDIGTATVDLDAATWTLDLDPAVLRAGESTT